MCWTKPRLKTGTLSSAPFVVQEREEAVLGDLQDPVMLSQADDDPVDSAALLVALPAFKICSLALL